MRTLEEINHQYNVECAQFGHKQHVIERLHTEIEVIRKTLHALNLESDAVIAAEKEKKAGETNV